MRSLMRKCNKCGVYTLHQNCPTCQVQTSVPIPVRYSPEDRYGKYRRKLLRMDDRHG